MTHHTSKPLKRHPASLTALLLWAVARAALANEEPPLECPHCGSWEINTSEPSGTVGERVSIDATSVSFPTCGEFRSEVISQSASLDASDRRTYRTSLRLHPQITDQLCKVPQGGKLRLDIEVSVGYHRDGGLGRFSVFKPDERAATLVASGWNFARDNPCDSGSDSGSAACMQIANARMYRSLAQEAYAAYALPPHSKSHRLQGQFNPARFAAATLKFCLKREAGNGGGSWPYVWGLGCQSTRMQAKLSEFHTWRACVSSGNKECSSPNESFDTSASDEPQ